MSIKNNIIAKIKEEIRRDDSILFLIGMIKRAIIRKNFQDSITWLISINKKIINKKTRAEVTIRKYVPADIEDKVFNELNKCEIIYVNKKHSIGLVYSYNIKVIRFNTKIIITLTKTELPDLLIKSLLSKTDNKERWILAYNKKQTKE